MLYIYAHTQRDTQFLYMYIYVCMYVCIYVCKEYLCLPVTAEGKFVLMYLLHKLENKFQYIFMNKSR